MSARGIILMVGILSCLPGLAWANKVTVLTSRSCSTLNLDMELKDGGAEMRLNIYFNYVAGFLSGKAVESGEDFLRDVEFYSLAEEVVSQCKLRPTAQIIDIARQIEKKLRGH